VDLLPTVIYPCRWGVTLKRVVLRDREETMGEIFTAAFLSFVLILVGLSLGFLMLKVQGGEE